jgi:peptidoglycan biosynthesis protein MviN/MurJ (putative lipid II flippase)
MMQIHIARAGAAHRSGKEDRMAANKNSKSTAAIIVAIISLLILPIVFGPIAVVLAALAKGAEEPNANTALTLSIALPLLGWLIGWWAVCGGSFC